MTARSIAASASSLVERGLAWAVGIVCLALLATWIPHYLTWPWFRDVDAFATIAQSWDAGILPYRGIRGYNFPGQTYLLWILGKTAGWGRTPSLYAVDVALLLTLGAALAAWSRRCLGGVLPGLVAYLAFIARYLSLDYSQVAQRDWQAACLTVPALLTLQSSPRGTARVTSAFLAAVAFAFRPHVVLFIPALWSAVDENVQAGNRSSAATARAIAEWSIIFVIGAVLLFAPLIWAGVFRDFVGGLSIAMYGGPYGRHGVDQALAALAHQVRLDWTLLLLAVAPLLWIAGGDDWRRSRTWSLAMLAAFLYKPLHPVQHDYLLRPLELMQSVAVALLVAWLLATRSFSRPIRTLAIVVAVVASSPTVPRYCSLDESVRALAALFRGAEPESPPLGSRDWLHGDNQARGYTWSDYRSVLSYVRSRTDPDTYVANVLRQFPFPSVNGPAARLSPFMVESGICWMLFVNQDLDASFAASLQHVTNSIVVWSPNELVVERQMRLPQLVAVIRREYQSEARFGRIEVWRRRVREPR